MSKQLISSVCITLALGAASASAAVVTRTFGLTSVIVTDLYSATFDAALTPCGGSPTQECTFFSGTPPVPRDVVFTNIGTGTGYLTVEFETTTGEILTVKQLRLNLPDQNVKITDSPNPDTDVRVRQGDGDPGPNDFPYIEAGWGTGGRDIDGGLGSALGRGMGDPDEGVAIGQAGIFQHDDQPNGDTPDFATFVDIVETGAPIPVGDGCAGPYCTLIPLLNLDGIRYRLEGTVSTAGGNALVMKHQTANNSILTVSFSTAAEPTDPDGDGIANNVPDNCPLTSNVGQADGDGDGRGDACDNCSGTANNTGMAAQCDGNGEGYGNRCDGDLNNNSVTNAQDYAIFRSQLGGTSPTADVNCNDTVNAQDYAIFRSLLGTPPGTSGLACAGTFPCPSP